MPLTKEGLKTLRSFKKEYGPKKGESIFYAWMNKNEKKTRKMHRKKT